MLQNSFLTKHDQPLQSIEKPIPAQQILDFVYGLSSSLNNQHLISYTPQPSQISSTVSKFIKALPDLSLFIDGKDSSID